MSADAGYETGVRMAGLPRSLVSYCRSGTGEARTIIVLVPLSSRSHQDFSKRSERAACSAIDEETAQSQAATSHMSDLGHGGSGETHDATGASIAAIRESQVWRTISTRTLLELARASPAAIPRFSRTTAVAGTLPWRRMRRPVLSGTDKPENSPEIVGDFLRASDAAASAAVERRREGG